MIKKFFEPSISEPLAPVELEKIETVETQADKPDKQTVAALMAKQGVKNDGMEPKAQPIQIPEKKEEPKSTEKTSPAVPAIEPEKVEEVKSESPAPKAAEPKTEEPKISEKTEVKVPSLQDFLKSQPNAEVLKAMGYDEKEVDFLNELKGYEGIEFFKNFIQAFKEGKAADYLREWTTDYTKMSAEEVMLHQLRLEYPKAGQATLNALYKKKVIEAYNLESEDDAEKEEGRMLMEAEADKYRDVFSENQKSKLLPTPPAKKGVIPEVDEKDIKRERIVGDLINSFNNDPFTVDFLNKKEFSIGEGDDKFTFKIDDAEGIADLVRTGKGSRELSFDNIELDDDGEFKSGTFKSQHNLLVQTVNKYGMNFINALINHYLARGGKKTIESIDNAKEPTKNAVTDAVTAPKSIAEAMARFGKLNSGG